MLEIYKTKVSFTGQGLRSIGKHNCKNPFRKEIYDKTTKITPAQMLLFVIDLCGNKMYGGVGFPICKL
jgi:hypothetical protein